MRPLGGNRAGEIRITRFLRNPRVTPAAMLATACARTCGLVEGRHVLAIQDTTTLRDDGDRLSVVLHPTIAVDAVDGAMLGLVHAATLRRTGGKKAQRQDRPFDEKESRRWLDGAQAAAALSAAGAACVTVVADREADIFDMFARKPGGVELLVRALHDRVLEDGTRLFDCTEGRAALGRISVALPAAPGRRARTACLALWARAVVLVQPHRRNRRELASLPQRLALSFVEAREVDPPQGAAPAHWRLLTTHPVETLAAAQRLVGFYRQRWTIEQLFRVMKTKGFDVEALRIADPVPYDNLVMAILVAAVQVLQLVRERDGAAQRPIDDLFEPGDHPALVAICASLEGKTARQKNPHPPGSLAYAAWICARLGGWTGYYGKPGPVVILAGYHRLKTISQGWTLARLM